MNQLKEIPDERMHPHMHKDPKVFESPNMYEDVEEPPKNKIHHMKNALHMKVDKIKTQ